MKTGSAKLLMIFVCIARGSSFLFSKALMNDISPMAILAVRFIISFVILAIIFRKKLINCTKDSLYGGLILGGLYTLCMALEMYGLRLIESGVCSLIENTAIILVPLYIAALTRTSPNIKTIICAFIAVIGVGCFSITDGFGSFNFGIVLTILAAVTFGWCVIATDKVSEKGDPITIGMIQLGTMGVLSLIMSLMTGSFSVPSKGADWLMILFLALICSCFGFAFQPVAQKYISAETAAMFTAINPLTACILGIVVVGESCSPIKLLGCFFIMSAIVIFNLSFGKKTK